MKPLAISIGCPAGIGPEVVLAAWGKTPAAAQRGPSALLIGDPALLKKLADDLPLREPEAVRPGEIAIWPGSSPLARPIRPGKPTRAAGAAQLAWIDQACDLVASGRCSALVTGPVSKEVVASSGAAKFRGHTEHLAERLGAREVVMAFALERAAGWFATSLVTTHLPLRRVPAAITPERVASASYWLAKLLADLGEARAAIAVAGLNPHAGEGGLLGGEEIAAIAPGIVAAKRRLARARLRSSLRGPLGAESAFRLAAAGAYQGVVAMYHDQATIACKLLGFGEMVNVTLGLPIVRTSVDHGTGYDLAGKNAADPAGMRAAIALAARLASI